MASYICILFRTSAVIDALSLKASDDNGAIAQARTIWETHPGATTFAVWDGGRKLPHPYPAPQASEARAKT
jgi:hypothetical protein